MASREIMESVPELGIGRDAERLLSQAARREVKHPSGWEPGVAFDGERGLLCTGPREQAGEPSSGEWAELLAVWDLDPEKYEIDPNYSPQFRAWDSNLGGGEVQRFYYYKANIRLRGRHFGIDVEELLDGLKKWKRQTSILTGPQSLVVPLADWQIGKGDGDGVKGTVERIRTTWDMLEDRIDELKRLKVGFDTIYLIGMGDMLERCSGNYPAQQFTTELNEREQFRLTYRLLRDGVAQIARKANRLVLGGVAGNHGEERIDGKAYTTPGDNKDLLVVEMVATALQENDEAYGHCSFIIPEERLSIVLDINGVIVGFTHGHLASRGADPQRRQKEWIKDMAFSDQPIGDARLIVTGHYHHFSVVDHGPKVHLQCPAQDSGSLWWANKTGAVSTAGTLSFVVGEHYPMGFDHLRVLGASNPSPHKD